MTNTVDPATAGPVVDVAAPYTAPVQPPERPGPLTVRPSRDAHERLARVAGGDLVDSGGFHLGAFGADAPPQPEPGLITFTTPSGDISCTGAGDSIACAIAHATIPRPPKPVHKPPGNWVPTIELNGTGLTYGVSAGNPLIASGGATLPYGSTIRLGEIECLSATDGLTCAYVPSGTGFHLSRDDFTPLKSVAPIAADTRVEPRTGKPFCGALVTREALAAAIATIPAAFGRVWTESGPGDYFTCADLQMFGAGTTMPAGFPAEPRHVLVFDRGRFVGTATDRAYARLRGTLSSDDPTLIRLSFYTDADGHRVDKTSRARYRDGRITLLDPIPEGAVPLP